MLKQLIKSMNSVTFYKVIAQCLVFFLGLMLLAGLLLEFAGGFADSLPVWARYCILIAMFIAFSFALSFYKAAFTEVKKKKDSMSRFFFWGIRVIILILLFLGTLGVLMIFETSDCQECAVYKAVGLGIVTIWACIFLGYFIWAVYYYNINLGLTDEEWQKIAAAKEDKRQGNFYNQADIDEEPEYNPYNDQTFGLPAGTVRGMIAFTLLFGAIAMLVVSFGMTNEIDPNSFFWDQYDFYKTAFLMMIAFYFGSRSLEYLKGGKSNPATQEPSGAIRSAEQVIPDHSKATGKEEPILAGAIDPMSGHQPEPVPEKKAAKPKKSSKKDDDFSDELDPMNP
ncbi:MAG: hypothetical protein RIM99_10385 [Cyclobacteriaceae bacterium]